MLSTENPPPDLSCPCEDISQRKTHDERAPDSIQVDLFKSGLDDTTPIPKFSIRDYVFDTRGQDIKNNWPFSEKNLQLCLKYGVMDVLPPFESLDSVKHPSIVQWAVENDHSVGQNSDVNVKNINSGGFDEDRVFPSTTTSQTCSDVNSVPPVKIPNLEPDSKYLTGFRTEKSAFAVQASGKVKNDTQNSVKKCRLIVKLNNIAEPKLNEDFSVNNSLAAETMASKVCPVCKIFSSSSNTTLNAHIDQCLSGEATVNWTTNLKVIKHRIKPRKTKFMVDIYETALCCTLEDLDRRNGTNWASSRGFSDHDSVPSDEEKNKKHVDSNHEGEVYIDSSGTKLRILSRLGDLPSNTSVNNESGQSKVGKRDKRIQLPSSKKHVAQKHKIIKSPSYGRGRSPRTNHCAKVIGGLQKNAPPAGCQDDLAKPSKETRDQIKSDGLGMIKQWIGSKRTVLKKKSNFENGHHHSSQITKNLVRSGSLSFHDMLVEREDSAMPPSSYDETESPHLSTRNNKRKERLLSDSHDGCMELPHQKKMLGFSMPKSHDSDYSDHRVFSKSFYVKQSRKGNPSVHEGGIELSNGTENNVFSSANKKLVVSRSSAIGTVSSCTSSQSINEAISSGSKKFSSLKKKLLSVRHALAPDAKKTSGRKNMDFKNPRLQYPPRSGKEMMKLRDEFCSKGNLLGNVEQNAARSEKAYSQSFVYRARVSKFQNKRKDSLHTREGVKTLNDIETSPESDSHLENNTNSFAIDVSAGMPKLMEEVQEHNEFGDEPTYNLADTETFAAYSKSLDGAYSGLAYPSDVGYGSQNCREAYGGHCPTDPTLGVEQEVFCSDKMGSSYIASSGHLSVGMDVNETEGTYFLAVDPIPIPGPPGSFLPSPGRMSSEELQGNSSLTACRMQSSYDKNDGFAMDSSDSPVSAMSAGSDSVATKSDSISIDVSTQSCSIQHEIRHGFGEDGIEPVVKVSTFLNQAIAAEKGPNVQKPRSDLLLPEMSAYRFTNIHPCCCSRKDGAVLSGLLIDRESQQHSTTDSHLIPAQGKKMSDDQKKTHLLNLRAEFLQEERALEHGSISTNSPVGSSTALVSHHSDATFKPFGDCESPSPSAANPVLRLMGKNLMVVNEDENLSLQTWSTKSSTVISQRGWKLCVDDSLSTGNIQNEHLATSSHGLSVFVNKQVSPSTNFDINSYSGLTSCANIKPHHSSVAHPMTAMFSSSFTGNFTQSSLVHGQQGCSVTLDTPAAYDIVNVRSLAQNLGNVDSSCSKRQELTVIDGTPETEAKFAVKATSCDVDIKNTGPGNSSFMLSASKVVQCDPRRVNPVYNYQARSYPGSTSQLPSPLYFSPSFS